MFTKLQVPKEMASTDVSEGFIEAAGECCLNGELLAFDYYRRDYKWDCKNDADQRRDILATRVPERP